MRLIIISPCPVCPDVLIISAEGNDLLNQNISNRREVVTNKIIDTKTQIIRRYFLARVIFKFNSVKKKEEEDEDDY